MNAESRSRASAFGVLLPLLLISLVTLLTGCPEKLLYPDLMKPVARYSFYTGDDARQIDRWLVAPDPDEPRRLNAFDLEEKKYAWSSTLLPDCMVVAGNEKYIYAYPGGCREGAPLELLTLDAHSGEILSRTDASPAGNVATFSTPPQTTDDRLFVPLKGGTKIAVFTLGPSGVAWEKLLTTPNATSSQAKIVSLSTGPNDALFLGVGYESCEATLPTIFRIDVANNLVVWQAVTQTCTWHISGPQTLAYTNGLIFTDTPKGFFVFNAQTGYREWDFFADEMSECNWTVAEGHAVSCLYSPGSESYFHVNLDLDNLFYEYYPCGDTGLYFDSYTPALILHDVYYLLTDFGILAFDIASREPLSLPSGNYLSANNYIYAFGDSIWAASATELVEFKILK